MDVADLIQAVRPHLAGALIATDFDGTLAPLVPDPEKSRPVDGTIPALTALSRSGAQVAVITGRDARTVVRLGSFAEVPDVVVAGLYGAETWRGGELTTLDTPQVIERLRVRLPKLVARVDPAVWIEDKRLSLVVHARRAADPEGELAQLRGPVDDLAAELGLEAHPGADVLELRLPGYDKAGVLTRLAAGRDTVLFLGDDLGDVPAMREIRKLRSAGARAYSVGVRSSGIAAATAAADVVVDDPSAAVELLSALVD